MKPSLSSPLTLALFQILLNDPIEQNMVISPPPRIEIKFLFLCSNNT